MESVDSLIAQFASTGVEEETKVISFAGKGLQLNTEEDASEIAQAIKNCPGMTTLRLEGNTVGVPAAEVIGGALATQSDLRHAFWKDMFTGRDKSEIPKALDHLSRGMMLAKAQLVVLDLSDNAFGPTGLVGIQKLLESSCCTTLEELHLNNNGLGISGAKMLSDAVCNCIEKSKKLGTPLKLKVLVCGRNRLENEGAIAVSKFLKQLKTLVSVAMPQNGIYSPGIKALSDAFESNPDLEVINLEDNSLTEEGAKCIAPCLHKLKNLQMLNLGDCLIRSQGAKALASVLTDQCPELADINLGFNEIDMEGGVAVASAMKKKSKLLKLNLNGNQFGEDGIQMILDKMEDLGKSEFLASLSEDEGDDDGEDEEEVDTDEGKGSDSENEVEELPQKSPPHKSPMSKVTFADYIACPSAHTLIQLSKTSETEDYFSVLPSEPSVSDFLQLFIKVSSVVTLDDEDAKLAACRFADSILRKAYSLCQGDALQFNDKFLVETGLIKGEDKKPRRGVDISGSLLVLAHAVKQDYFHPSTRDSLQFFLSRPLQYATASSKSMHACMQALFQV